MATAYRALRGRTRLVLLEEWKLLVLSMLYYIFLISLTPHQFLGLGKLMAGRIYQMRVQRSYLAAHTLCSWLAVLRQCPRSGEEEETFSHAILHCQSTSCHREHLLQGLSWVGPVSSVWLSGGLLLVWAALIRAEATNNPPDMFPSLPSSPASMGFHSLSVSGHFPS